MLKNWKLRIASAALAAVSVTAGCFDFDEGLQKCQESGPCKDEQGGGPQDGGADGGADAGEDAGCTRVELEEQPGDNQDFNCDGVDGTAATGLFVDPANGGDAVGRTGEPDQPLRTLTEALARIQSGTASGKVAIYLAQGTYNEPDLKLEVPVSLYGGYGGVNDWFRKPEHITHLDGGTVGFTVRSLRGSNVVLERLTITSSNGAGDGGASIAMYVVDTDGVNLRQDVLAAGLGGTGAQGLGANAGTNGADGGWGTPGDKTTAGRLGSAGRNTCGGVDAFGGTGKPGGASTAGITGDPGRPSGAPGGGGGPLGVVDTSGILFWNCAGADGGTGQPGAMGDGGIPGAGGGGVGELRNGVWVATQTGEHGGVGGPGSGGGAGGSGGSCPVSGDAVAAAGGGSGGGGAGGCGGEGGGGGGGGGASIALLLVNSDVGLSGVTLRTQGGGPGGAAGPGGNGGTGGPGGAGGAGGNHSEPDSINNKTYTTQGGAGGAGGRGGNGGIGGPGGGGGGGPSVGVWCGPNAAFRTPEPLFNQGGLGNGGRGGSAGDGGIAGDAGITALTLNCPDAGTP